jgi:hypothetical protein
MSTKSWVLFMILVLGLSSCATKYAQRGSWPDMYGYRDEPVDGSTYQISFYGNSATPVSDVNRYALFRAAEITIEKGFDYFVVIDAQHDATTNSSTMAMAGGHSTSIEHAVDPQTGQMVPVAVTTSNPEYMTSTTTEHSVMKTIRMFKGVRPADNAAAYDAKSMLTVMGPTINR